MNATAQSPFLLWEWTLYSEMKRYCTSQQHAEINNKIYSKSLKTNRVSHKCFDRLATRRKCKWFKRCSYSLQMTKSEAKHKFSNTISCNIRCINTSTDSTTSPTRSTNNLATPSYGHQTTSGSISEGCPWTIYYEARISWDPKADQI